MGTFEIKEYADKQILRQKLLEKQYPNRHAQIHKQCCKRCPSSFGSDPETEDIKATCSKDFIADEFLFVCAWRPSKLCKGNCDFMGIDQGYLDKRNEGKQM